MTRIALVMMTVVLLGSQVVAASSGDTSSLPLGAATEPASLLLLGTGLITLAATQRRHDSN